MQVLKTMRRCGLRMERIAPHRVFPGNRPSLTIGLA